MNKKLNIILLSTSILFSNLLINGDAVVNNSLNSPKPNAASNSAKAVPAKIAFLNTAELMGQSGAQEWVKAMTQIGKELEPGEKHLKEILDQFNKDKAELESLRKTGIASEAKMEEVSKKLEESSYKIQVLEQRRQMFIQDEQKKAYTVFWPKVTKCVDDVVKEQGWDMVIAEGIIFSKPQFDITKVVISKLDAEHAKSLKPKDVPSKDASSKDVKN